MQAERKKQQKVFIYELNLSQAAVHGNPNWTVMQGSFMTSGFLFKAAS